MIIAGGGGSGATAACTVSGGAITGFSVSGGSGYTSVPAVIVSTLPSVTITDLLALSIIPPFRVTFAGERVLQSIASGIQSCHPNHWLYVDPAGNIRVVDQRTFTNNTLTLGSDSRLGMPQLHRDLADTFSQLIVRGDVYVSAVTLGLKKWPGSADSDGGLQENFAWGSYTNAQAKANYKASDWQQFSIQTGQDEGSCTCPSTTTITVTSQNTSLTWAANALDQTVTGLHALVTVYQDALANVQQVFSARVISNTALTAGGSSTLTLDRALPSTSYNAYRLYCLSSSGNIVYRRYKVTNAAVAAQMQQWFPHAFAYRNSDGTAGAMTTAPVATCYWSSSGNPPYNQASIGIQIDPVAGNITTFSPTCFVFGGGPITPVSDLQVFLPVASGSLTVQSPSGGGYAGTLYTVEGISRTKTITVRERRDYSLNANMQTYCNEQFDAIKDIVVEGSIPYLGLNTTYLAPGQAVSIAGNTYTTGYESLALPVASVDVQFNAGPDGTSYAMTLHLSNRKARFSGAVFTRPPITGQQLGIGGAGGYETPHGMVKLNAGRESYGLGSEISGGIKESVGGFAAEAGGAVGGFGQAGKEAVGGFGAAGAGAIGEMMAGANPEAAAASAENAENLKEAEIKRRGALGLSQ